MQQILIYYEGVPPTTWVYLSSLLMIGLFFKFSRFWSVRNVDLLLLILFAPGLLLVILFGRPDMQSGVANLPAATQPTDRLDERPEEAAAVAVREDSALELWGYYWLLGSGLLLLVRLLLDSMMVRRPLLTPNLSTGGLIFIGCSLFVFLMANVLTRQPTPTVAAMESVAGAEAPPLTGSAGWQRHQRGPGYPLLAMMSPAANKSVAILSHLAIVLGMVVIGYRHMDNITMGIGAATLYLMLPYTALMTGEVIHHLPAALLVSALMFYRQPLLAGCCLGLAAGVVYYPLFLLPLWLSFYWPRGLLRFLSGVTIVLLTLAFLLTLAPGEAGVWSDLRTMFGVWLPLRGQLKGIWDISIGGWDPVYRIPVLAAVVVLSISFAIWPAQKNLGTLFSCSAAIMLASQFWHGFGGGTFMGWYLPLVLLTIFRPNLEDRVALTVLREGWFSRRRAE